MIAFHYPPVQGSSGVHRTLSFSKHLPRYGWQPTVLTVPRFALPATSPANEQLIPENVNVIRSFALDAVKHLSLGGRYPLCLAIPDRLISWLVPAVVSGYLHIRKHKPDVIFSTYPLATAHAIGYWLQRLTGVPWVADFRDPMAQEGYPENQRVWRAFKTIEERAVKNASRIVFAAPGAREYYEERYSDTIRSKAVVIENGFDEDTFSNINLDGKTQTDPQNKLKIVHSGVIYPSERDPTHLFSAIRELKTNNIVSKESFDLTLRSSGHVNIFREMLERLDISDIVNLRPPVNYHDALTEMCSCDALLLLQAENCNYQIPAKLYEYLRAGRPIIALTDPDGDSAGVLKRAGCRWIARLDSEQEIVAAFSDFLDYLNSPRNNFELYDPEFVRSCDRESKSRELAATLDSLLV